MSTSPRVTFAAESVEVRERVPPGSHYIEEQIRHTTVSPPMAGPGDTQKCTCCPYGYHIDLDFLNFCREMESGSTLRNLKRIQRAKRKLRKSMEIMLDEKESQVDPNSSQPDIVNSTDAGRLMHMINYERSATKRVLHQIDSSVNTHIAGNRIDREMSIESDDGMTPASPLTPNYTGNHTPTSGEESHYFNTSGRTDSMSSLSSLNSISSVSSEAPFSRAFFFQQHQQPQHHHMYQQHNHSQQQQRIQQQQYYEQSQQQHQTKSHQKKIITTTTEVIENPVLEMATAEMKPDSRETTPVPEYESKPVLEMATAEMKPRPPSPPPKNESTRQKYTSHLAAQYKRLNNGYDSPDSAKQSPARDSPDVTQTELASVREAMAVSLTRMRELEEQIKAIPILQVRISVLKEEKRLLNLQLKASKTKPATRSVATETETEVTESFSPTVASPKQKTPPPTLPKPVRKDSIGVGDHSVIEPYLVRPDLPSGYVFVEHKSHSELHTSTHTESTTTTVLEREVNRSYPSLNINLGQQQIERETRASTSDLTGPHFTINQIQRNAVPKPLTRSIGTGDGNVLEGDSGLHVHEKEFTTLFIGQNSNVARRNVGIECRVPTRDVGVSFQCEEEKPETRTVGVNVNCDMSDITTTLDFKGETELRMALRGVLQRDVHSVGVSCDLKPDTVECGTVPDAETGVSVGCGDEDNRTDVEIRMPVVTKSISASFRPETATKCLGTEPDWVVEASTNTAEVDVYHKSSMTDKQRCSHTASNTDAAQLRDENNQTETKMFLALDQVKHASVNTQKLATSSAGVATDVVPVFDAEVNTSEKISELFYKPPATRNIGNNTDSTETRSSSVETEEVSVSHISVNTDEPVSEVFYTPPQQQDTAINTDKTDTSVTAINTDNIPTFAIGSNTDSVPVSCSGSNTDKQETSTVASETEVTKVSDVSVNTIEEEKPVMSSTASETDVKEVFDIATQEQPATSSTGSETDITKVTDVSINVSIEEEKPATSSTASETDIKEVTDIATQEKPVTSSTASETDVKEVFDIATQEKPDSTSTGSLTDMTKLSDTATNTEIDKVPVCEEEFTAVKKNNVASAPPAQTVTMVDVGVGDDVVDDPAFYSETVKVNYPMQKILTTEEIIQRGANQANVFLSESSQSQFRTDVDSTHFSSYDVSLNQNQNTTQQVDVSDDAQFGSYEVRFPASQIEQRSGSHITSYDARVGSYNGSQYSSTELNTRLDGTRQDLNDGQTKYSSYELSYSSHRLPAVSHLQSSRSYQQSSQDNFSTFQKNDDNTTFIEEHYIIRDGEKQLVTQTKVRSPTSLISSNIYQYSTDQKTWSTQPDVSSSLSFQPSSNQTSSVEQSSTEQFQSSVEQSNMEQFQGSVEQSNISSDSSMNNNSKDFESRQSVHVTNPYKTVGNLSMISTSPERETTTMARDSSRLMSESNVITRSKRTNSDGNLYIDSKRFSCPATMQNLETIYDLRRVGSVEDFMPDDIRKYMSIDPSTSKDSGFGEDLLQRFSDKTVTSAAPYSSPTDKVRNMKVMKISKKVTTRRTTRSGEKTIVQETKTVEGPDGQVNTSFIETLDGSVTRTEGEPIQQVEVSGENSQQQTSSVSGDFEEDRSKCSSLDRKTGELRSILKRKNSDSPDSDTPKKGHLTFAESVIGGTGSSSEESDEEANEDSDSGTDSEASFEEGSYDSQGGNVIYSCQDDEAIAQGMPGAQMFDQNIRETYEISDEVREACSVLATYLVDSTQVQTKELNASLNSIQAEWFQVSSHKLSSSHQVEDFLSSVNEISKRLLEYIVNMTDANGNTAIHYCISHCNFEIAGLLLDSEICDINKANKAGYTPIMLAGLATLQGQEQTDMVTRLFSLGDINARAQATMQTALMLAASHGRLETVRMLCESGADVNLQDCDGSTALMCACEHGHLEIVNLLLAQSSIDAGLTDNEGSTALTIAMEAGHKDVGVVLYKHLNFSKTPSPPQVYPVKYTTLWTVYVTRIYRYIRPPVRKVPAESFL